MPINILMPALSPTMTEGKLASWHKKEGDAVQSGDVLCEIETDKATMEVEAVDEGILGRIVVPAGTDHVAVNSTIALLLEDGEDASALDLASVAAPVQAAPTPSTPAPTAAPASQTAPADSGTRLFASPLARRMAERKHLDLAAVKGSGPHGRIVKRDVEKALAEGTGKAVAAAPLSKPSAAVAPPTTHVGDPIFAWMPEYEVLPNSNMRKAIARRLTESARDVPHFNVTMDVEIDKLLGLRRDLNARAKADYKLSVNDFVVKATARALTNVPDCNVAYTDDAILRFKQVDICIAVSIEGGLITPILKNADAKGLAILSSEAKALAAKARDGKLQPEEYQGGTFTISNMGMFGVKAFNSILNPPQGGILSVGAGEPRPVVKEGALGIATVMTLTLAVDHRCIDGATAAAFMQELKGLLEDPLALML
ncbi:pyruvate dehydrogenase complex dihydrolipoamide acetyltransferase [Magnetospira thiophila]